jgi:hypothetical protein
MISWKGPLQEAPANTDMTTFTPGTPVAFMIRVVHIVRASVVITSG